MARTQPITLLICALGGEGGGVLTEWLVEAARLAGYAAQSTSIPGVAQRTGATTYYLEVFPEPLERLAGRRPVFSLSPVPGTLDAIVSSELLETVRQIGNALATPQRTLVISAGTRALTTAERMVPGDGRADSQRLLDTLKAFSREHHVLDMTALAGEAGTVVSAVMLGAIAGSGLLPFPRAAFEAAVRGPGAGAGQKAAEASLRGFASAHARLAEARSRAGYVAAVLAGAEDDAHGPGTAPPTLPPGLAAAFPVALHDLLALGHARVADYQDAGYAELYTQRLARVLAAEQAGDPAGVNGFAITREAARWLALWMAFDDIVRVAALKARASRARRVRAEVHAGSADIVRVYDHFKPGVPEFAGLLPEGLATRLRAWDRRRQAAGREPWSMPLKIGSHSVHGLAALRLLASMRWLRRRGSRFAQEQALIERWLGGVCDGTRDGWTLGLALARCGRLIKGYGSTNERGKDTLLHIVDHLARAGSSAAERATAVDAAREAALADDSGRALDAALRAHGAPARPVQPQPIRWMKRPAPGPAAREGKP